MRINMALLYIIGYDNCEFLRVRESILTLDLFRSPSQASVLITVAAQMAVNHLQKSTGLKLDDGSIGKLIALAPLPDKVSEKRVIKQNALFVLYRLLQKL